MAPFVRFDYILRELATSMDLDEDKILNDPREAAIQAKFMAELQAAQPQAEQAAMQGAPSPMDPTGTGGGVIAPGNAPAPDAAGFTGGGPQGGPPEGALPPELPASV